MLESGAVADVGTYEELHRRNERFRSMVNESGGWSDFSSTHVNSNNYCNLFFVYLWTF